MIRNPDRRAILAQPLLALFGVAANAQAPAAFMQRAFEMKRLAEAAGDQSYGAALAAEGRIVAESPSKVVVERDATAHAEMSTLRLAVKAGAPTRGAVLYSTSIPCAMCQAEAAKLGVARMIYGAALTDGGAPRGR